jgi:hypothetical protein
MAASTWLTPAEPSRPAILIETRFASAAMPLRAPDEGAVAVGVVAALLAGEVQAGLVLAGDVVAHRQHAPAQIGDGLVDAGVDHGDGDAAAGHAGGGRHVLHLDGPVQGQHAHARDRGQRLDRGGGQGGREAVDDGQRPGDAPAEAADRAQRGVDRGRWGRWGGLRARRRARHARRGGEQQSEEQDDGASRDGSERKQVEFLQIPILLSLHATIPAWQKWRILRALARRWFMLLPALVYNCKDMLNPTCREG